MKFYILTLFPEMIKDSLKVSILGKAWEKGILDFETVNIRDFTLNKHMKVDDYPYGGGAGMVMQCEPIYRAYQSVMNRLAYTPRVIYLTPQGHVFKQSMAKELSLEKDLILLCGHYEGVDERVLILMNAEFISIGDYVLTGGELPALVMIDCIARMVSGVLSNDESAETESFQNGLLEHPHYTRPEIFESLNVPEVLLSGHHAKIEEFRLKESLKRTRKYRPDMLEYPENTNKN